jgi:hypothetical protein
MFFLKEKQCFFLSLEFGNFAKRWCSSHMKTLSAAQYIVQWVTKFSLTNKSLGPPDSTIDIYTMYVWNTLQDIQCLFHLVKLSCLAQRWYSSHFKTLRDRQHSFEVLTPFSLLNKGLNSDVVTLTIVLQEIHCFFHSLERGYFPHR